MMRIKLKFFIVTILALLINQSSSNVFANNVNNNNTTTLDGIIGEWDPTLTDQPNFKENGLEVNGTLPEQGDYYTISVTVPLNMEFYVLPNSQLVFGSFYSPVYTIKNNGSKNLSVAIRSFNRDNNITLEQNKTPLYIEKLVPGDKRTQMELEMCTIEDLDNNQINKKFDLTSLNQLTDSEKSLYTLNANEKKGVKFSSDRWELPKYESNKDEAVSNFTAGFVFSVHRP